MAKAYRDVSFKDKEKGLNLQATTRPPILPTPKTRPQSRPSTLTIAQPSSPILSFISVLGCALIPSSPPSTWPGSNSGLLSPDHRLSIFSASVLQLTRSSPCMLAATSSLGPAKPGPPLKPAALGRLRMAASASRVKRSDTALSCRSGGSRMCTSGSEQRGSWMPSTVEGASTRIATSCMIVASPAGPVLVAVDGGAFEASAPSGERP